MCMQVYCDKARLLRTHTETGFEVGSRVGITFLRFILFCKGFWGFFSWLKGRTGTRAVRWVRIRRFLWIMCMQVYCDKAWLLRTHTETGFEIWCRVGITFLRFVLFCKGFWGFCSWLRGQTRTRAVRWVRILCFLWNMCMFCDKAWLLRAHTETGFEVWCRVGITYLISRLPTNTSWSSVKRAAMRLHNATIFIEIQTFVR